MNVTEISLPTSTPKQPALAPVLAQERISSVDTLRGFALLGILLMNIVSFALPFAAYNDPTIAGGARRWNLAVWAINYILFEGKMRAIFSMLFGASALICPLSCPLPCGFSHRSSCACDANCELSQFVV